MSEVEKQNPVPSLGDKVIERLPSVPLAPDRTWIAGAVEAADRFILDDSLADHAHWCAWMSAHSIETNLDAIGGIERPIWIEYANRIRSRHLDATPAETRSPARVGYLLSPSAQYPGMIEMHVLHDDGEADSLPSLVYARGLFSIEIMARLSWGARNRYHLTQQKCMERMLDQVAIDIPEGLAEELGILASPETDGSVHDPAEIERGNNLLVAASFEARSLVTNEIMMILSCLLAVRSKNVSRGPDGSVAMIDRPLPVALRAARAWRGVFGIPPTEGYIRRGRHDAPSILAWSTVGRDWTIPPDQRPGATRAAA